MAVVYAESRLTPSVLDTEVQGPVLNTDVDRQAREAYQRGVDLAKQGLDQAALAAFDHALTLADFPEAHNNRGIVLRRLSCYVESLEACERALALRKDYPAAHHNRGAALGHLDRGTEALEAFTRALELNSDLAEPRMGKALILLAQNNLEAADAEMEQLWLQHTVPEMHRQYARLLEKAARRLQRQGQRERAREYRQKARLAWVRAGFGMWTEEQAEAALDEVRRIREESEERLERQWSS